MTQQARAHSQAVRSTALLGRSHLVSCACLARTSPGARIFSINGVTAMQTDNCRQQHVAR
jgi:hypothetical protein